MLQMYHKHRPKPKVIAELKETVQVIVSDREGCKKFLKRLKASVVVKGGHF